MDIKDYIKYNCYRRNGSLNGNTSQRTWWVKKNIPELYDEILSRTSFLNTDALWNELIFIILSDAQNRPKCVCGKDVSWAANRYLTFCSTSCGSKNSYDKRKITNHLKYGVDNPFQNDDIKQQIIQTNLEKYGVENPSQNIEIKKKIKETFAERFDGGHPQRDSIIRNKVKETCNIRYDADSPFQSEIIDKKIKDIMLERYGVEYALQNHNCLDKQKATTLLRYGVENFNQQHLTQTQILLQDSITSESDFSELGLSRSHTYKIIKQNGILLEPSRSIAERELANYIESITGRQPETNIKIDNKEFDIYDPLLGIAIEYNGVYWHSEDNGKGKLYHRSKTDTANQNNIKLIHIFSTEWEEKKDIVKSRLLNIFNLSTKIYARKCEIRKITAQEERIFFNKTHLQGYIPSSLAYGLFENNIILAAMSFSKPRFNKTIKWELLRYSSSLNISVVGGGSKLFTKFNREQSGSIISYSDLRWGNGNLYYNLGFKLSHITPPGFFYTKNGSLENRMGYQKHKLKNLPNYSDDKSAGEIMKECGYSKIWDCGHNVFILEEKVDK